MRVECDHCHVVAEAELAIAGEAIEATCSACGGTTRAQVRVADPYRGEAAEPPAAADACPKCGAAPVGEAACPRCGLAVERMAAWAAADAAAPAPDPALDEAWTACRDAWSDETGHDRVATLAHRHQAYAWLARRYRAVLRDRPADPVARARLDRIANLVAVTMTSNASPARTTPVRRTSLTAIVLLLALIVVGGVLAARLIIRREQGDSAQRTPAAPVAPDRSPHRRAHPPPAAAATHPAVRADPAHPASPPAAAGSAADAHLAPQAGSGHVPPPATRPAIETGP